MRVLDSKKMSPASQRLLETLEKTIVGQKSAVHTVVSIVENYQAGFCDPTRPAGNALFLGPTGVGKTRVVEALAQGLFGDARSCIKIDCAEYQHGHEIAKLIGSPPGYLGHRETHPMLTQEALNQWHTEKMQLSILLFDEIEKASDTLWNLLLGILDKAKCTLGDNRVVDFSKTIIIMTSNLGAREMATLADGGLGFVPGQSGETVLTSKLEGIAVDAAKRKFSPEFMNRIQNTNVFHTLTREQISKVLDVELDALQFRLIYHSKIKFFIHVMKSAKAKLLKEGFSPVYGARHLKRAIEKRLQEPLARLAASGQLLEGDEIGITDTGKDEFEFSVLEMGKGASV